VTDVPDASVETANMQVSVPVPLVVRLPLVQLVIATSSKTTVTVLPTEKPVPATVTVAPIGPCPGVTVILGEVTTNVPPAV
jgi:hypothetical protein